MKSSLWKYVSLIKELPVNSHRELCRSATWKKYPWAKDINRDEKEYISISRQELFHLSRGDISKDFVIKVLMWGYPAGGRGKNISNLLDKGEQLIKHLNKIRHDKNCIRNWDEHVKALKGSGHIAGLGCSTYSKFLYFMKVNVIVDNSAYPALILDAKLATAFDTPCFKEVEDVVEERDDSLASTDGTVQLSKYHHYLKAMHTLSGQLGVEPDQLEMFLFIFGSHLE